MNTKNRISLQKRKSTYKEQREILEESGTIKTIRCGATRQSRSEALGRVVGQEEDLRSYKVIPHGQNRIYFIKKLHLHPNSPLDPVIAGEQAEPNEEEELAMYNEFAAQVFAARDREFERDPSNISEPGPSEHIMQVIAPERYSYIRGHPHEYRW